VIVAPNPGDRLRVVRCEGGELIRSTDEDGYREFAAVQLPALQRPAYLLCGD
jgi:hypothetical protein